MPKKRVLLVDDNAVMRIFNGTSLKDWDGDPSFWHVENGAIVGLSTNEHPVGNTYIAFIVALRRSGLSRRKRMNFPDCKK